MPAKINYGKCINCKACYDNCPTDVFDWDLDLERVEFVRGADCWHCGVCVLDCPKDAVTVTTPFGCL